MKKLKVSRKQLHDGGAQNQPMFYSINVGDTTISAHLKKIKRLSLLEEVVGHDKFTKLLAEEQFENYVWQEMHSFRRDGLDAYYLINENYLMLFTYGEWQPGRYKLYLEAVWYIAAQ